MKKPCFTIRYTAPNLNRTLCMLENHGCHPTLQAIEGNNWHYQCNKAVDPDTREQLKEYDVVFE